ncbi:MAG: MBL fold metallo-hydrolase [Alphaproteobacteria bacterium]|nr:MBL fold metallo-hydrolase [Alphaproteobacteria bacterium]
MIEHPELRVVPVRTPTLPPATHTNAYVLGRRRLTIIDPASPWPDEQARLAEALQALVDEGAAVERILLTHHHVDHIGGVNALRARFDAPVVAHPRTVELLQRSIAVDETLVDGDRVETDVEAWVALHTPGHASGHLCLHQPGCGAIVAGDMVAGEGTIVLEPPEGDLAQYLAQLDRLRSLGPSVLFPAHGPALRDPARVLTEYIDHRHHRTAQLRAALAAHGPATPLALVPHIYGDTIPRFVHPLAARQVHCHLVWLADRGEVRSLEGDRWEMSDERRAPPRA